MHVCVCVSLYLCVWVCICLCDCVCMCVCVSEFVYKPFISARPSPSSDGVEWGGGGCCLSFVPFFFLWKMHSEEEREVCVGVWRCCSGVWRWCSGVWRWCSGVWRRVEVCGGVWRW